MVKRVFKIRTFFVMAAAAAVISAGILTGCAQKGPILLDFGYQTPPGAAAGAPAVVVAIAPFKDDRGKEASVAGRRYAALRDTATELVVQGTVSDKVTSSLKEALRARGVTTQDAAGWDLTIPGIPSTDANLLISGEIKKLWVETVSSLANTTATANVELRIVTADVKQKKIIRTLNLTSMIERRNVTFSAAFVESTLSEALSVALNQIFNDEELKSRL